MLIDPFNGTPGAETDLTASVKNFQWGTYTWGLWQCINVLIVSTTTDSGNTPTTTLRAGNVIGKITSTSKYTIQSDTATDGSDSAVGILLGDVNMLNPQTQVARDSWATIAIAGPIRTADLVSLSKFARSHLRGRFIFDDDLVGVLFPFRKITAKTADYTVLSSDNDTLFTTTGAAGAVNFTLPTTIVKGARFRFFNTVNQNMTVTAPANKLVAFNNATATSVALSTAGNKIGSGFEITADEAAAKYLAMPIGAGTVTVA